LRKVHGALHSSHHPMPIQTRCPPVPPPPLFGRRYKERWGTVVPRDLPKVDSPLSFFVSFSLAPLKKRARFLTIVSPGFFSPVLFFFVAPTQVFAHLNAGLRLSAFPRRSFSSSYFFVFLGVVPLRTSKERSCLSAPHELPRPPACVLFPPKLFIFDRCAYTGVT